MGGALWQVIAVIQLTQNIGKSWVHVSTVGLLLWGATEALPSCCFCLGPLCYHFFTCLFDLASQ